jgi:hypothetical protein
VPDGFEHCSSKTMDHSDVAKKHKMVIFLKTAPEILIKL